jgi:YgiT-type zinc finger domain-containing protein
MKCVICKLGETHAGQTIVTLHRGQSTIIIKDVPAKICDNCGEYYLSDEISEQVMNLAENAVKHNAEVEILRFAA